MWDEVCAMWWSAQGFLQLFPLPPITCGERVWLWSCPNPFPSSLSSPHFSSPHDHTHSHFLSLEFSISLSKTLHGFTVSLSHSEPPPLLQWQLSYSASAAPPMAALSLSLCRSRTPACASSTLTTRTAQEHQPVHSLLSPLEPSHCHFQPPPSR